MTLAVPKGIRKYRFKTDISFQLQNSRVSMIFNFLKNSPLTKLDLIPFPRSSVRITPNLACSTYLWKLFSHIPLWNNGSTPSTNWIPPLTVRSLLHLRELRFRESWSLWKYSASKSQYDFSLLWYFKHVFQLIIHDFFTTFLSQKN